MKPGDIVEEINYPRLRYEVVAAAPHPEFPDVTVLRLDRPCLTLHTWSAQPGHGPDWLAEPVYRVVETAEERVARALMEDP